MKLWIGAGLLCAVVLMGLILGLVNLLPGGSQPEAVSAAKEAKAKEATAEDDEVEFAPAPNSPNMTLSIPKLGINALVLDGVSEEVGLTQGVWHLPGTGFPWIPGSNTYLMGNRLGSPGTPGDRIFCNLHTLEPGDSSTLTDSDGNEYDYAVSNLLQVAPDDLKVTAAPTGTDMVSLQTDIEDYGDLTTLGPNWNARLIVQTQRAGRD